MKSIIIFASGKGSNAQNIINHFKQKPIAKVSLIVSNNPNAGVIEIAKSHNIPFYILDTKQTSSEDFLDLLASHNPDLIILAGYLKKIPESLILEYPNKIINIHPSLLPKYGGKGMYGHHVHDAVKSANESETGITIHYVNEHYDKGNIIQQAHCLLTNDDTVETIANKISKLEYFFFPNCIEYLLCCNNN